MPRATGRCSRAASAQNILLVLYVLASHGPVVAGKDLEAACNAIVELEATARLALLTPGLDPRRLSQFRVSDAVTAFNVEWDA